MYNEHLGYSMSFRYEEKDKFTFIFIQFLPVDTVSDIMKEPHKIIGE